MLALPLDPNSWLKLAMFAVSIPRMHLWPLPALTLRLTNSYPLAGRRFNFEIRTSPYVKNYNYQIKFKNEIVYCNKTILVIQYIIIDFNNPYKHEV